MRRSNPLTWDDLRVGGFILVSLLLLALGIFYVGQVSHVFGDRYRLVTLMNSAAGLVPGAAVQVAGQNVGQVENIQWIEPEERQELGASVAVQLSVDRAVQAQIRSDSRARVRTQGLLGDRVIDIRPGSPDADVLQPGDTVPSEEPVDYEEVLKDAAGAVGGLSRLTQRLEELTRRMLAGEGSLGQLVVDTTLYRELTLLSGSLGRFLRRANRGEGSLGRLLTEDRLYEEMVRVTARLDTLTAGVASGRGTLGRLVASDSLYRELREVASRSNELLRGLQEGRGAVGRLMTEDEAYEALLKNLADLNALLQEIRTDPHRYLPKVEIF